MPPSQVRYRRDHLSGRTLQHFPLLDDLLKDVCDGAALLAVIHFYCPELIRLEGAVAISRISVEFMVNAVLEMQMHIQEETIL